MPSEDLGFPGVLSSITTSFTKGITESVVCNLQEHERTKKPAKDLWRKARVVKTLVSASSAFDYKRRHPDEIPWRDMTQAQKRKRVTKRSSQLLALLLLLYSFLFGLAVMSDSMKVLTGGVAGSAFDLIDNPVAGLMVGIFATVLVQSSSTSTSIVVGLVGAGTLTVRQAIPVVMGANIGTSVTSTLVSLAHLNKPDEFERAFSGACVHDMFNILCVFILLPIESAFHILEKLTDTIVESITGGKSGTFEAPVGELVAPLAEVFLVVDKEKLNALSNAETRDGVAGSLIKGGIFHGVDISDKAAAGILLAFSLLVLCGALILLVKLLSSALKGAAGKLLAKAIGINGYLAMFIGAVVTLVVQSSSIATSTLVPLVGLGIITLEQMFPLTLGANVGTTCTAILASLTQDTSNALQIAFCHLFFNLFGIAIFYPIPFLRKIPIALAKQLGREVKTRRYLAGVYILIVFLVIPGTLLGLSTAGTKVFIVGGLVLMSACAAFVMCVWTVRNHPEFLPDCCIDKEAKGEKNSPAVSEEGGTEEVVDDRSALMGEANVLQISDYSKIDVEKEAAESSKVVEFA